MALSLQVAGSLLRAGGQEGGQAGGALTDVHVKAPGILGSKCTIHFGFQVEGQGWSRGPSVCDKRSDTRPEPPRP